MDHDDDFKKEKFFVVYWTSWNNENLDQTSDKDYKSAEEAVIKELKEKGYRFTGIYHQRGNKGVPVLNDGSKFMVSMRRWGQIMARALGDEDPMAYTKWAWETVESEVYPS